MLIEYQMGVGHQYKECRSKENKSFIWGNLFDFSDTWFFWHVSYRCHTSVGHRHVSDTATRLLLEVFVLHRSLTNAGHEIFPICYIMLEMEFQVIDEHDWWIRCIVGAIHWGTFPNEGTPEEEKLTKALV